MSAFGWNDPWQAATPPSDFAAGLAMGMLETKRSDILRTIQLRFCTDLPIDLAAAIKAMDNLDDLDRWLDAALTASSLDAFRSTTTWADSAARKTARSF